MTSFFEFKRSKIRDRKRRNHAMQISIKTFKEKKMFYGHWF